MRLCTLALLLSALAVGCMSGGDDPDTAERGLAEIQIDLQPLLDAGITRVTLQAAGQTKELTPNLSTGTYDGALILPVGEQSLVALAYADTALVGASNPTPVQVQVGQVTRVLLRVLDLTGSAPPVFGPFLESLVYPSSAQAGDPIAFTAHVLAPDGAPISYAWTSTCSDSTFGSPAAATTTWSKAAQGTCMISMVATSSGFSIQQDFGIVVFPAGSSGGAIDASAQLISRPRGYFSLDSCGTSSDLAASGANASCPREAASPALFNFSVGISSWGGSTAGAITLSDSCGGKNVITNQGSGYASGAWLPPVTAGVCVLTARAVSADNLAETLSIAVLVRAGTPVTWQPPTIYVTVSPGCSITSGATVDCGAFPAGLSANVYLSIDWAQGLPESLLLSDDCDGGLSQPTNLYDHHAIWHLPSSPGRTCTLSVHATNLGGGASDASMRIHLQ
jgi:hypothetical protein